MRCPPFALLRCDCVEPRMGGLAAAWLAIASALTVLAACGGSEPAGPPLDTATIRRFEVPSAQLGAFHGRPTEITAGVVLPEDHEVDEGLPVCFSVHGFGGSHEIAWRRGPALVAAMRHGRAPRMIHVFLDGRCERGHHVFADSANNGPWGTALVEEFVPALEAEFGACGAPRGRFLTGHSSGGWAALWLQVAFPEFFGGCWATAPDPVDFRDFTGVDIYRFENAFVDPEGEPVQLVRRDGEWVESLEAFVRAEAKLQRKDGQYASFDAVFGPRGDGGEPLPLFDRQTGVIDRDVAEAWRAFDISAILDRDWARLGPALRGKLHVFVGTADSFRLEGSVRRLVERLGHERLREGGLEIVFAEGRDHRTVLDAHEFWPDGLRQHVHRAMGERFDG